VLPAKPSYTVPFQGVAMITSNFRSPSAKQVVLFAAVGIGIIALRQLLQARKRLAAEEETYEYDSGPDMVPEDYLSDALSVTDAHARRRGQPPVDVAAEVADSMLM
jgi:hypothetical protein